MEKVKIGVIANTHGLKGELKIKSFSEFNEIRYQQGQTLYVQYQNQEIPLTIAKSREQKGLVYVVFDGLHDINEVEKYRGCALYVNKQDMHDLGEDEVYYFELMDCDVYLEDGTLLGKVEDVLETGANAVLRVNKTILIPYVKAFVKEADIKAKKLVVYSVEGLL